MSHFTLVRDGMSSATESALSGLAIAFVSSGGGVVGTNDYLIQAQVSPNNTVLVNTGRAFVPTSDLSMVYATKLDATQNVTISPNSSGITQIDSIVLYIDKSVSPDSTASNVAKFADARGTGGAAPTNGQILSGNGLGWVGIGANNPYIILANISVPNSFSSISSGNITDKRSVVSLNTGQVVPIPQYEEFTDQSSAPSAPSSGKTRMFTKGSGLFSIAPSGTATQIGSSTVVANGSQSTSFTIDWSKGNTQSITLTSASFTFSFSNPTVGMHLTLLVAQDSGGSKGTTLNLPGTVKWPSGIGPILSTGANKVDLLGFIWDGNSYYGFSSLTY